MKQVTLETEVNFPHRKKKINYYLSYTFTKRKFRSLKACDYHLESNLNLCVINIEIDGYCKMDNRFRVEKQQQQKKKNTQMEKKIRMKREKVVSLFINRVEFFFF